MADIRKHVDLGTLVVIVTALLLFVLALFLKGFSHDLLLEAAVFLVSVKLILMSYKNSAGMETLCQRLDGIRAALDRLEFPPRQEGRASGGRESPPP
jgi:hypothetical protein